MIKGNKEAHDKITSLKAALKNEKKMKTHWKNKAINLEMELVEALEKGK